MDPIHQFSFPAKEGGPTHVGFDPTSNKPRDLPYTKGGLETLHSSCPSSSPNLTEFEGGEYCWGAQEGSTGDGDQKMEEDSSELLLTWLPPSFYMTLIWNVISWNCRGARSM